MGTDKQAQQSVEEEESGSQTDRPGQPQRVGEPASQPNTLLLDERP